MGSSEGGEVMDRDVLFCQWEGPGEKRGPGSREAAVSARLGEGGSGRRGRQGTAGPRGTLTSLPKVPGEAAPRPEAGSAGSLQT